MLRLFKFTTLSFVAFMVCHEANTLSAQTQVSPSLQRAQQVISQAPGQQQKRTSPQLTDLMNLRRYNKYRYNALGQRVKAKQPNPFTWALGKPTANPIASGSIGMGLNDLGSATLPTLGSSLSSNAGSLGALSTGDLNTASIGSVIPNDLMSAEPMFATATESVSTPLTTMALTVRPGSRPPVRSPYRPKPRGPLGP